MCRDHSKEFRVIVPNSAKSAATMLALASDEILMGYLSEIGPIDPQIRVVTPQGQITFIPAQSIIDSVGQLHSALQQGIDPRAVIALVQRIDPYLIDVAQKAVAFSERFARDWLSKHMLRNDKPKAAKVSEAIADNRRWLSHGRRIGVAEARGLGLKIVRMPKTQKLWNRVWEYYSRANHHLNITKNVKVFETRDFGLNLGISVAQA